MASNHAIAIDIGRHRLRAVLASQQRNTIRIQRVLVENVPDELDSDDAESLGRWVGDCLKTARFPRENAVFALAREHVGLKRMMLPSTDDAELPQMTRLALQRELPFNAENAVIDGLIGVGPSESVGPVCRKNHQPNPGLARLDHRWKEIRRGGA